MSNLVRRVILDGLQVLLIVILWLLLFTWVRCGFC